MGENKGITLRNSVFPQELLSSFKLMYETGLFTDLTIVSRDKVHFAVHKVIACASSDLFSTASGSVDLDFSSEDLAQLVDYMYSGELKANSNSLSAFCETAKELKFIRAVELCEKYLREDRASKSDQSQPPKTPTISQIKKEPVDSEAVTGFSEEPAQPVKRKRGRPRKVERNETHKEQGQEKLAVTRRKPQVRTVGKPAKEAVVRSTRAKRSHEPITAKSPPVQIKEKPPTLPTANSNMTRPLNKSHANVSCTSCEKTFNYKAQLLYHRRTSSKCVTNRGYYRYRSYRPMYLTSLIKTSNGEGTYSCFKESCTKPFKSVQRVKAHIRMKHYPKIVCKLCTAKLASLAALNLHSSKRHIKHKSLLNCNVCIKRTFIFRSNLDKHKTNSHPTGSMSTTDKKVKSIVITQTRESTVSSPRKKRSRANRESKSRLSLRWSCSEEDCGMDFTNEFSLNKHVGKEHPDVNYSCPLCNYSSKLNANLLTHLRRKHNRKSADIPTCELCNKSFCRPAQLSRHKFSKHRIEEPGLTLFNCDFPKCKYVAVHKIGLQKHQKRHNEEKPYSCDLCERKFKSEKGVEKHKNKSHFNIRPYICDQCGQAYGEAAELRTHIARHSHTKSFQCDICPYSTHEKGNFKTHLYNRHGIKLDENMTTFECEMCEYTTDNKARFRDHMKSHNSIRDLPCPHCGKLFMTKKCLRGHIVKVHNPKTLTCGFCSYATADKSKLNIHLKVMHTQRGFKPYKCAYCDFRCATGGNCRKHVANKHKGMEVKYVKLDVQPTEITPAATEPTSLEAVPALQQVPEKPAMSETSISDLLNYDLTSQQGVQTATVTLTNEQVPNLVDGTQTVMLSNFQNNVPVMNIVQGNQGYEIFHTFLGQGLNL